MPTARQLHRGTYECWINMQTRCYNAKYRDFHRYGGRGIRVCDRWRGSFDMFLEDMGPRPDGMTLERIDNDCGYSPENCRWASPAEQARNRRSTITATVAGETLIAKDWISRLGISPNAFYTRARRDGCQKAVEHYLSNPKWARAAQFKQGD